ncbi:MAG: hypothetical protein LQ346_004517 [Caloplaca aetnensis]|nr:MAG: hypothetical protein LQ346_004517 [Caloplaca aetnensis]
MEPLSLVATIVSLLSITEKVAKSLENFHAKDDVSRQFKLQAVKLRISLSLAKVKAWQDNWFGQSLNPGVSPETLWGPQASVTIQHLVLEIVQTSKFIEQRLSEVEDKREDQPRSRWKRAVESVKHKQRSANMQLLYERGIQLSDLIDKLWIFSDTAFDALHGLLAIQTKPEQSDDLIRSALHSRAGSLELYRLCSKQTEDCNLEMDLRKPLWGQKRPEEFSNSPYYRLVTEPDVQEIRKMFVESLLEQEVPADVAAMTAKSDENDLQLFKTSSSLQIIKITQQGSSSSNCLRISRRRESGRLKSSPTSLEDILKAPMRPNALPQEPLPMKAKIELAFKVTEATLYLLGTPWLSSLNSTNLRRLDSTVDEHSTFMLRTPTSDLKDLMSDDPAALNETSQLFRLGLLLIEIAIGTENRLETPGRALHVDRDARNMGSLYKLPQVEKIMGLQYCKATAFCLQFRQERFSGPEKYSGKVYGDWERYLAQILKDYHSQVFLR